MSIWHAVLVKQLPDVLEICVSSLLEMFKLNIVMEMRPVVSTPIKPQHGTMHNWFLRVCLSKWGLCHGCLNKHVLWITCLFEWCQVRSKLLQWKHQHVNVWRILWQHDFLFFSCYQHDMPLHKSLWKLFNLFWRLIGRVMQLLFLNGYGRNEQCNGNLCPSRFTNHSNQK